MDENVCLIIGKNNCGKSSLIDIIDYFLNHPQSNNKTSGVNGMEASFRINEDIVKQNFRRDVYYGMYGHSEYDIGKNFCGELLNISLDDKDYKVLNNQIFKNQSASKYMEKWDVVSRSLEKELTMSLRFRRLNAERDIVSEVETDSENVDYNGNGATNLVRKFINTESYDESIVEKIILSELNNIMEPEAHFDSIRIQQIRNDSGNYEWEIFLEENGHRYALSKSGSGLKTVLLILINLYLIPCTKEYREKKIIYAFEEIENNLHPALQRRVFEYLYNYSIENDTKIFITSHSHIAINAFYGKEKAKLYHVIKERGESELFEITNGSEREEILDDLDVKASDLLQSNGIIWVEGPSDRIYILKWLKVFTDFNFIEGQHFQFMYYGGKLLSHYEAQSADDKTNNLINILTTNRHASIVIDSDKRSRQSKINDTKKRIKKEFEDKGYLCWITKGKEIENYLSAEAVNAAYNSKLKQIDQYELFPEYINKYDKNFSSHKVDSARKICEYITLENSSKILDLEQNILKLYEEINKWNKN